MEAQPSHTARTAPGEEESALSLENGNNKILKGDYRSKAFYSTSDEVTFPEWGLGTSALVGRAGVGWSEISEFQAAPNPGGKVRQAKTRTDPLIHVSFCLKNLKSMTCGPRHKC